MPVKVSPGSTQKENIDAPLSDYQIILKRNIFSSAAESQPTVNLEPTPLEKSKPVKKHSTWTLIGTVSGGEQPLATLSSKGETATYRLNEELPDGATLSEVGRNFAKLRYSDGQTILLESEPDVEAQKPKQKTVSRKRAEKKSQVQTGPAIESLGENRWLIPALLAEDTRSNIGDLLKQAQAVPYLDGKETTGFQIRMIQQGSFVEQIGLKKGDILREVNGVMLNSPEKALQIFGQLRQASRISIGLERRGKAMTFAYEIR